MCSEKLQAGKFLHHCLGVEGPLVSGQTLGLFSSSGSRGSVNHIDNLMSHESN